MPPIARVPKLRDLIRQGKGNRARSALRRLSRSKIPRADLAEMSSLAWQSSLPALGIRLLNPVVRPARAIAQPATPEEQAEYAACLVLFGAGEEALEILRRLDTRRLPEVILYQAMALGSFWSFAPSIPLLTRYVRLPRVDSYHRLLGLAHLAEALVYESRFQEAKAVLRSLLHDSSVHHLRHLLGKALELSAQNFIWQKQWVSAEQFLERAEGLIRHEDRLEQFYVRKWKAILTFQRKRAGGKSSSLSAIRGEAIERHQWETVRECDRFEARAFPGTPEGRRLLWHLYFGSPFESFRRKLLEELGEGIAPPREYLWRLGQGQSREREIDLAEGKASSGREALKVGQLVHRLLVALSSDFYRPFRLATLHFRLYPHEYFNPISSPPRVHDALKRLKSWFAKNDLPLFIDERNGFYRLAANGPCTIRVRILDRVPKKEDVLLQRLRATWADELFSLNEACRALDLPSRSLLRVLQAGLKAEALERVGKGPSTRYRFAG